jgi:DNA-binding IclR family transcriptional regulator
VLADQPPSVIEKARRVIDVLAAQNEPIGPTALSRATGLPKSTVFRLCHELLGWGIVERVGHGFMILPQATALSAATSQDRHFREIATPFAVELYAITRMTTNISVLQGTDAVMLEKVHGTCDTGPWQHPGMRAPAHSSSAGRAILAFSPIALLTSVLSRPLVRTTPRSLASPQSLRRELWSIRRRGLAISRDEVRLGQGAIAAPLFGADGLVVGALAVSTSSEDIGRIDVAQAVVMQAQALSSALRSA